MTWTCHENGAGATPIFWSVTIGGGGVSKMAAAAARWRWRTALVCTRWPTLTTGGAVFICVLVWRTTGITMAVVTCIIHTRPQSCTLRSHTHMLISYIARRPCSHNIKRRWIARRSPRPIYLHHFCTMWSLSSVAPATECMHPFFLRIIIIIIIMIIIVTTFSQCSRYE